MSRLLGAIWANTYSLLVDDGQLAIGALAALAITGAVAYASDGSRDVLGWLLLALVLALVLANLYRAGINARRYVSR
jgi:hypothetical protein